MPTNRNKIKKLKQYFKNREDIIMAFVFGSQAKSRAVKISDWDIACYFKPLKGAIEWENEGDYPQENEVLGDLIKILETDNIDLIVLNRAPADMAATAIQGLPLVIKNRILYLEFMLRVSQAADDYRQTVQEYADVYWRSTSLAQEDRKLLNKRIIFIASELKDIEQFQGLDQFEYQRNSLKRKAVERWIENLMNAAIDVAKIILASEKQPVPPSYREILKGLGSISGFEEDLALQLANWVSLRNILAHEYLDIRWQRIEDFLKKSEPYFKKFIKAVKKFTVS